MKFDDDYFLARALMLADTSEEPVKCASILVDASGKIVAQAINTQRKDNLTLSHAETKAITLANKKLGRKLPGITAYCSCEPCTMCLTALIFARVDRIVFANRLNDLVPEAHKINIDCFEFVKHFPYQPTLEFRKL